MNFLFVIPARKGSKGIPGKNKKMFGHQPLISYSIDCALAVTGKENICVTTDDEDIISIVKSKQLDVPFKRPVELSGDSAGTFDVLVHALNFYEKTMPVDAVVLLQPTSPFRTHVQLREAIALYNDDLDMVVSVNRSGSKLNFIENKDGFLELEPNSSYYELRQDAKVKYSYNGAIYIINGNSLKNKKLSDYKKVVKYEMDVLSSFDIDTPLDWEIGEYLLTKHQLKR